MPHTIKNEEYYRAGEAFLLAVEAGACVSSKLALSDFKKSFHGEDKIVSNDTWLKVSAVTDYIKYRQGDY